MSFTDTVIDNGDCNGELTIERLWRADNPDNGLAAAGVQTIRLRDDNTPVISNCPADIVVQSNANCTAIVTWTVPTATDDCGLSSFSSNIQSGSTFSVGTTVVTYTAIDHCGNMASCSFSVTVIEACCNHSPVLTLPADYTGCPDSSTDPSATGTATATIPGTGCGLPSVSYSDVITSTGSCNNERTIQRTWTAVNPANPNISSSGVQWITLVDTQAPIISGCPQNIVINAGSTCNSTIVNWTAPTASDDCGIQSFTSNISPGSSFGAGTTTVTYTAIDQCGKTSVCSFTVTVLANCCNGTPSLTIPSDFVGCPSTGSDPSVTGQATGSQPGPNCSPPTITYTDVVTLVSDCHTRIDRTWRATNSSYPSVYTSAVQVINLRDTEAPDIISCPADITAFADADGCVANVNWAPPTVSDNCSVVSFTNDRPAGSEHIFPIGSTVVTYTAIDGCGNSSSCSFTVTVMGTCCDQDLIVTCPANYSGCPGSSIDPSITGTASSNASAECPANISYYDEIMQTGDCDGSITVNRYWVATKTDLSESDTCVQLITLVDNIAPSFSSCVSDITLNFEERTYTWDDPSATDNCSVSFSYSLPKGTTFAVGETVVSVSASDLCGNSSTCSFKVTVLPENMGSTLVVDCPGSLTIGCNANNYGPVPKPDVSSDCDLCTEGEIPWLCLHGKSRRA